MRGQLTVSFSRRVQISFFQVFHWHKMICKNRKNVEDKLIDKHALI